ncbi:Cobalt import ATP-binding protein CbiO [uncultured Gammaproteobacteria bacterium]
MTGSGHDQAAPIMEVVGLEHTYSGEVQALAGLTLTVPRGARLAVLGANGCGKTTLFLHMNGSLRPSGGRVELEGRPVGYGRRELRDWRGRVGLVLQDPDDQVFAATVAEDVSFGPLNLGLDEAAVRVRVAEGLAALGIADLAERPTHMLSHGQKRRVALAGVLAMRPQVLLLDEPTAGLDVRGSEALLAALERLNAAGTTLVFSTHDIDLAYGWADQVAVLDRGRCLRQGPADRVLADGALLERAGLRAPLLLDLALACRRAGMLGAGTLGEADPLPRTGAALCAILEKGLVHV